MRFTRKKTLLDFAYSINDAAVDKQGTTTALDVTFSFSLSFADRIN